MAKRPLPEPDSKLIDSLPSPYQSRDAACVRTTALRQKRSFELWRILRSRRNGKKIRAEYLFRDETLSRHHRRAFSARSSQRNPDVDCLWFAAREGRILSL